MTDREFDKLMRETLRNYRAEDDPASWEHLESRLDIESGDVAFDDAVKSALGGLTADGAGNWSRMEQELVAEEHAFDDAVKEKVESYEAPYNPESWPVLHQKVSENETLRRRLVTAKVLEIAAILIACFTFYNFFPDIHEALIEPETDAPHEERPVQDLSVFTPHNESTVTAPTSDMDTPQPTERASTAALPPADESVAAPPIGRVSDVTRIHDVRKLQPTPSQMRIAQQADQLQEALDRRDMLPPVGSIAESNKSRKVSQWTFIMPRRIQSVDPEVSGFERVLGLSAAAVSQTMQNGLRVGMGASADLNMLEMPDDIFYSQGRQIKFSAKELSTIGYTAGASVLFDKGPLSFETGLYYSLKEYEPNRILHIGETFDVRTLDFQKINLNVVSIPLLVHWNFDQKGKVRWYATGGMNMNVIAVAHYDLIARNNFSSSAAPQDPQFQRNSQEVARVREHILDGAQFSDKSYVALSAGFGVERRINHRFSIFGQPTFNYQIPFFGISDQSGKNLQYASVLLGTRIKLK